MLFIYLLRSAHRFFSLLPLTNGLWQQTFHYCTGQRISSLITADFSTGSVHLSTHTKLTWVRRGQKADGSIATHETLLPIKLEGWWESQLELQSSYTPPVLPCWGFVIAVDWRANCQCNICDIFHSLWTVPANKLLFMTQSRTRMNEIDSASLNKTKRHCERKKKKEV